MCSQATPRTRPKMTDEARRLALFLLHSSQAGETIMDADEAPKNGSNAVLPTDPPAAKYAVPQPLWERVQYEAAFEFSPDCQLLTDRQGLIERANFAAASLLRC